MKDNKKTIFYWFIFLIFIAYLFSANYIFNVLIKTEREARMSNIVLPPRTGDLKFAIDEAKKVKLKWKDALYINGWVFYENAIANKREVYFVMESENETLIFNIENDTISRQDVTTAFNLNKNIYNHGFELYIPIYRVDEVYYQIGFIITDETGKYYSMTDKILLYDNDVVRIIDSDPKDVASLISMPIDKSNHETSFYLDNAVHVGKYYFIEGWGFINGLNTNAQKSYIVMEKDREMFVFDTKLQIRKDITTAFSKFNQNLDSSGFLSQIPVEKLEKGKYRVGLYMVHGDQTGLIYSDEYVDVNK